MQLALLVLYIPLRTTLPYSRVCGLEALVVTEPIHTSFVENIVCLHITYPP